MPVLRARMRAGIEKSQTNGAHGRLIADFGLGNRPLLEKPVIEPERIGLRFSELRLSEFFIFNVRRYSARCASPGGRKLLSGHRFVSDDGAIFTE